jgi:hypothetical protein
MVEFNIKLNCLNNKQAEMLLKQIAGKISSGILDLDTFGEYHSAHVKYRGYEAIEEEPKDEKINMDPVDVKQYDALDKEVRYDVDENGNKVILIMSSFK